MIPKQLNEIAEADLVRLIGVSESRQLEFKETIGAADEDIKEFLKDMSAMANAAGGDVRVLNVVSLQQFVQEY